MLYPLVLMPVFKEYLWGGARLREEYHKDCDFEKIAESWELCVHSEGVCAIKNGEYAGKTLEEYLAAEGPGVLGANARGGLPVLVKLIDAADTLSIQVHPDNAYAQKRHGGEGKTEFWYVIDCAPGAKLYYGLKSGLSKDEFAQKAGDGSIIGTLNEVAVQPGDAFLIAPGTVHAIGKDMTIAEVGTNSNITYRIYDFNRKNPDGSARDLHIADAAEVFRAETRNGIWENGGMDCGPFAVREIKADGKTVLYAGEESFRHLLCIQGNCVLNGEIDVKRGDSIFIPAGMGEYTIEGGATLIVTTI